VKAELAEGLLTLTVYRLSKQATISLGSPGGVRLAARASDP